MRETPQFLVGDIVHCANKPGTFTVVATKGNDPNNFIVEGFQYAIQEYGGPGVQVSDRILQAFDSDLSS